MRLFVPWHWLTAPKSIGIEQVPDRGPLLFVGNHTIFGVLDAPMMFFELYTKRGIFLRSLGDHLHFRIPLWRDLLRRFGVVDGTRENCAQLMRAGESILVFPGGGREVAKRKGEKYKLIWKNRVGFARMAIRFGCPIVPFAAVGAEDAFDILLDANDLMASPLGAILERLGVRDRRDHADRQGHRADAGAAPGASVLPFRRADRHASATRAGIRTTRRASPCGARSSAPSAAASVSCAPSSAAIRSATCCRG